MTQARTPKVLIMAAGTGGHIYPGLAIAKELELRGWNVHWMGTPRGMENLGLYCLHYQAQTWGYLLILTDRYPSLAAET